MAKETKKVVKETKTSVIYEIPSYSDGKLVGWGQCEVFKENPEGLKEAKATLTEKDVVDLNRQRITDVKNNVRRFAEVDAILAKVKAGKATPAELVKVLNKLVKSNPSKELLAKVNELVASVL